MSAMDLETLSPGQLRQLLHFYADAGVEWMIEDEAIDRYAEFRAAEEARKMRADAGGAAVSPSQAPQGQGRSDMKRESATPQMTARGALSVPDQEIAEKAANLAAQAATASELVAAVGNFTGCNLRNSARNTAFFRGSENPRFAVVGGVPTADDDRQGMPFSGAAGDMLARMLEAIGLAPEEGAYLNLIPWRPPGNRAPTPYELEICRPFGLRLMELLDPQAALVMGNLPFRFLTGSAEGIHAMRGSRREIPIAGKPLGMLATFHPVDLIAAPSSKKLAWADLLSFRELLGGR